MIFFAKRGTSVKSHATHAARARNKRGSSVDFARILRGFCVGFARNLILFLFEREHEGYKRFADCTVYSTFQWQLLTGILTPEQQNYTHQEISRHSLVTCSRLF